MVEEWFKEAASSLTITELNMVFLREISSFLGIKTEFLFSRDFNLREGKTERLVEICKALNAKNYYTGGAARAYIEENSFEENGINLHYFDYSGYPVYQQLHGEFNPQVSIIDLIFNAGEEAVNYLKHTN